MQGGKTIPFRNCKIHKSSLKVLFFGIIICAGFVFLSKCLITPVLPSKKFRLQLYSNQTRDDLKLTFASAINQAKHSIFLQIYALTDKDLIHLLQKKSTQGIKVTIFFDVAASTDLKSYFSNQVAVHPVSSSGLMHRKILIIDEKIVFMGTANLTTPSLKLHDNLLLGMRHRPLAKFITRSQDEYQQFFLKKHQPFECFLLPDLKDLSLQKILNCIHQANKKIYIAMFTLTHPQLIQALIDAHNRGIDVRVAVDYFTAHGASQKQIKLLEQASIPLYVSQGQELLHHKWAYIDDQTLILGSANWTKGAFEKNQDCFLILHGLSSTHRSFMKRLWKQISYTCEEIVSI